MKLWHQLYGLMQSFQKNSWVVENEESQGPVIRKDFSYFGDFTQDVMVTISKKGAIVTRKLCTTKKDESVYAGLGYVFGKLNFHTLAINFLIVA
ncbi:MAG: hypothetical protein GX065_02180 [Firmicutes bacterium]|nr:hypothetical protein [Bacillota bacterium]